MARWCWAVAAGALLACGGGEGGAGGEGDVVDGQVPAECTPGTCLSRGASCGAVDDGCGGTLECGGCPAGLSCGGGGLANVCGAPACQPTTCAAVGAACGSIPDLCGGTLECGACPDGQTCGGGGTANVCGAPPATGEPVWSHAVSTPGGDATAGAGEDGEGNRYVLTVTLNDVGTTHTLRLQRLSPAGAVAATREWIAVGFDRLGDHFRMVVTPTGSVYLTVNAMCWAEPVCVRAIDFGGGVVTGSALVKLGPDGRLVWQRAMPGRNIESLAANEHGAVAIGSWSQADGTWALERLDAAGVLLQSLAAWAPAVAVDGAGDLLVATWGAVRKYARDGSVYWDRSLSGGGVPVALATASDGTIVVLAHRSGDVSFGPSIVRGGGLVVYVLDADGAPRFARGFPWGAVTSLALDPSGRRAAVVSSGSCGEIVVEAFDLANADLWRRALPDEVRCSAGLEPGPASYGADHRLLVTGRLWQTAAIGGRVFVPRGHDVFAVLLGP